jgi:TatD DNase family protein
MDGPVTFPKADKLRAVAQDVPLDRLLLETDGPYLTPAPHRGRRNEPAYLTHITDQIATLRGSTTDVISRMTTSNAEKLFNL